MKIYNKCKQKIYSQYYLQEVTIKKQVVVEKCKITHNKEKK